MTVRKSTASFAPPFHVPTNAFASSPISPRTPASLTMMTTGTTVGEALDIKAWSDLWKARCVGACRMLGRSSRRMICRLVLEVEGWVSKTERQLEARVRNLWNFSERLSYSTLSSCGSSDGGKARIRMLSICMRTEFIVVRERVVCAISPFQNVESKLFG